jgi:hypothetical protein
MNRVPNHPHLDYSLSDRAHREIRGRFEFTSNIHRVEAVRWQHLQRWPECGCDIASYGPRMTQN